MSAATATPSAATVATQTFEIRPFSGAVGAEIIGLDLTRPVNDEDFARIHRALKREFDPAGIFEPGRMSPDW